MISDNTKEVMVVKPINAKATRVLVNEITKCGASFYDKLDAESKFKEERDQTLMANTNMDEMEQNLRDSIATMMTRITEKNQEICHAEVTQRLSHSKCEKRKLELEQSEKRLSTLQNVKPTYMDQYDEMQVHLHNLFSQYIEKFQNLKWLETQMQTHTCKEQEKLNEIDRRMRQLQQSTRNEEIHLLQGKDIKNDLAKDVESFEELEGENANIWNWFHDRNSKAKRKEDLEALNIITNNKSLNMHTPLVQSNWEVFKLDQNMHKMSFKKSHEEHFAKTYYNKSQPINSSPSKSSIIDSNKSSIDDCKEFKFEREEIEDDLLDIDSTTFDEALEGDTSSEDF